MLIVKTVRCATCDTPQPTGPGALGFRLPPVELTCEKCGRRARVTFEHHVTWTFHYLWKLSFAVAFAAMLVQFKDGDTSFGGALLASVFAALLVGGVVGFVASYFLSLPVQLLLDVLMRLVRLTARRRSTRAPRGRRRD